MRRILLALTDESNDFQQLLAAEAQEAARLAGLALEAVFTGHDFAAQLSRVRSALESEPRPDAILALAVRDRGLGRLARDAARGGTAFVYLNRTEDELEEIRRESPRIPVCIVCADELETGRIHGRLFRALVSSGSAGTVVVYVQGSTRSLAARDRTAGMQLELQGSGLDVLLLEAGWTAHEAREAVTRWLGVAGRTSRRIALVGCHNDQIALGVLDALGRAARELGRPELATVPVVGCDGTPTLGRRLVLERRLAATVELPRAAATAVGLVSRFLENGVLPPPLTTLSAIPIVGPALASGLPASGARNRPLLGEVSGHVRDTAARPA